MGYCSSCQAHRFEYVKNCSAAGFFTLGFSTLNSFPCASRMVHPVNLTQVWEALESTWASIPLGRFRHLVEPQRIEAVLRAEGVPNVFYSQCRCLLLSCYYVTNCFYVLVCCYYMPAYYCILYLYGPFGIHYVQGWGVKDSENKLLL
jgi:hypothetical protein